MPLWAKLLAAVVFIAVMALASGIVHAVVPSVDAWLVQRLGDAGVWVLLVAIFAALVSYGIYDHRKAGRSPNGR